MAPTTSAKRSFDEHEAASSVRKLPSLAFVTHPDRSRGIPPARPMEKEEAIAIHPMYFSFSSSIPVLAATQQRLVLGSCLRVRVSKIGLEGQVKILS